MREIDQATTEEYADVTGRGGETEIGGKRNIPHVVGAIPESCGMKETNGSSKGGNQEHNRHYEECWNKNVNDDRLGTKEEWTKVISRREAKIVKKISSY